MYFMLNFDGLFCFLRYFGKFIICIYVKFVRYNYLAEIWFLIR